MKRATIFLMVLPFVPALCAQTSAPSSNHAAIQPKAIFKVGETARFKISGNVNVQPQVNPRFASTTGPSPNARRYRLEGAFVASFLGLSSGEVLSGTLRFEDLKVRDWVSSSDIKELEDRLRQIEANSLGIGRDLGLTGTITVPRNDPYYADVEALLSLAQLALIPQMGDQPLEPGARRNVSRTMPPGTLTAGAQANVTIDYVVDVPIDGRPQAEFRVSTAMPMQSIASPPAWAEKLDKLGAQPLSRASSDSTATYLYDPDAHAFIFLRLQSRVEVRIEAESGDANAPVRIPVTIVTNSVETAFNVERVEDSSSPARAADLAAFETTVEPAIPTPSTIQISTDSTNSEVSLGDLARKTREQNQGQGNKGTTITMEGSGDGAPPPGFTLFTYPNGGMKAFVPEGARSVPPGNVSSAARFAARVGNPPVVIVIVLGQGPLPPAMAGASGMDAALRALFDSTTTFTSTSDTTLGGHPAKVGEFMKEKTADTPAMRGLAGVAASSDGKSLGALICLTSQADYPTAEPACHTILNSLRMP